MQLHARHFKIPHWWHWIVGFVAVLWVFLRSGTNPRRLTYPCQRAAMPLATNWLLATAAFFGGSLFLRRFARFSAVPILAVGLIWFSGALPEPSRGGPGTFDPLPVWEVDDPISIVCVMDSIPPTSGSLAPGDTTVPDEYLPDPAIDTLLAMLAIHETFLHRTTSHPYGIVGSDNVVVIKGNFQWTGRNTTNTDRIKGLIWQILQHPDGFSGEILVCDNTQQIGTGLNDDDNNSEDRDQCIIDVVSTFFAKGYPVYCFDWSYMWDYVVEEYSEGDYDDGFVYEADTKISYPKFRTPSGNCYVSMRYGIWDPGSEEYDPDQLCIVDFPVLKAHRMAGSTIAVKNWIGMLTTAYADQRYGGWSQMHYTYFWGSYALVARVMEATFPKLTIVDAAWTSTYNCADTFWVEETKMLAASTDPVAASWYAAKFMLTPIAVEPEHTNPDRPGSKYDISLRSWADYLRNVAGLPCTRDSSEMSVYDRTTLTSCCDDDTRPDVPKEYALLDNYPNPFNATTTIGYRLPVSSDVKLEVYNLLSEKVVTLVDGLQEAGYKSVNWDASNVSSGLYFYKLTAGDFTETRRMMLVK